MNEFENKENETETKDKIEPQHVHLWIKKRNIKIWY